MPGKGGGVARSVWQGRTCKVGWFRRRHRVSAPIFTSPPKIQLSANPLPSMPGKGDSNGDRFPKGVGAGEGSVYLDDLSLAYNTLP